MKEAGQIKCLVHLGWEIRICLDGLTSGGQTACHADLWRDGEHRCRIALTGRTVDPGNKLEQKAKRWIDDWTAHDHSGNTGLARVDS